MVINSTGEACIKPDNKCQYDNFVDYWAIVNALDNDDKLLAQLILWLIICILIVPFNLYLRIFTKHRFNEIDEENVTEADYSIIIRSLPADTT